MAVKGNEIMIHLLLWFIIQIHLLSFINGFVGPLSTTTTPTTRRQRRIPSKNPFFFDDTVVVQTKLGSSSDHFLGGKEFGTALGIVPDTADWDRIQRARHYARDPAFHSWPPCIRLFHPFHLPSSSRSSKVSNTDDYAFDVAQLVEDLDIEPFTITFDTWTIIPLLEVWQQERENFDQYARENDKNDDSLNKRENELDRLARENIESEILKADEKAGKRREKLRKKLEKERDSSVADDDDALLALNEQQRDLVRRNKKKDDDNNKNKKKSSSSFTALYESDKNVKEIRDEQQLLMSKDVFGGACILCLEPDEESKERLQELREGIREGLGHEKYFSPSSLYSWNYLPDEIDMGVYRPLIPISKFDSFPAAMDVARRLKGLWGEPLTMTIRDLHLISCYNNDELYDDQDYLFESGMYPNTIRIDTNSPNDDDHGMSASNGGIINHNHHQIKLASKAGNILQNSDFQQVALQSQDESWGCVAKIMLMGEEDEQNEEENSKMADMLLTEGQPGGGDLTEDFIILEDNDSSTSQIEQYLDDDDDFDEGAQISIGRVHFYTGEQRTYRGMPATSVVDAKDRAMGTNGMISGSARRRGNINREGKRWYIGEFGRKDRDFLPWHKFDKDGRDNVEMIGSIEEADGEDGL